MKVLPRILFCALLPALLSGPLALAETPAAIITEGQAAFQKGDMAAAKRAFELAYQLDNRNVTAINYLRRIKAMEGGAVTPAGRQQKELSKIVLPKVQFKEATLGEALENLKQQLSKLTEGKTSVSFVLPPATPEAADSAPKLTLSLTNVPFTEALRYVCELGAMSASYEPYAIVLKPVVRKGPGE